MYKLKIFAKSFLSLFAIMRLTGMSTKDPASVIIFLVFVYIFSKLQSDKVESRIASGDLTLSAILSALFCTFTLLARYGTILGGMANRLFCAAILFLTALGLLVIYFHLIMWLLQSVPNAELTEMGYSYAWIPYLTTALCILCWMPYFLYEYPSVMTPDSIDQYAQTIGAYELNNHHSVVHTAMIGLSRSIGLSLTGDVHTGLALYTAAQMLFMALVAGYVVRTLQKAGAIAPVLALTIGFYALMPYNGAHAVTMWKDIPFAGCMTLFAAALMRFLLRGNASASADSIPRLSLSEYLTLVLPYIVSGVLLCLLRPNGWYAFIVSIPFILIVYRRCPKVMLPVHLIMIALVLFVRYPVMTVYEIRQADFVESLSVPIQQIARVIAKGGTLSDEEAQFLGKIMDLSRVPDLYEPDVSDNIKNLIRENGNAYLSSHKGDLFRTWASIGLRHPGTYLEAYTAQTCGYWYPDVDCEVGLADGIYPNAFGLVWQPVISGRAVIKIKEILFKLPDLVPLYGALWSMGFMLWLVLLIAALSLRSGNTANALICLPFLVLMLTLCIAAPVAAEFRYAYPVFYALPLLIMSPFVRGKDQ